MTQETVLIAALSGRALAAAARRAGFTPLVVDAFGDLDMRESAGAFRCLGAAAHQGFRASSLLAALTELERGAERAPIGLVLGSGFEDTPRLIASLAKRFTLLGNGAEAIAKAKQPEAFFSLLDRLGIAHPETRLDTPEAPEGWLSKRIGGSGGAHVVDLMRAFLRVAATSSAASRAHLPRYWPSPPEAQFVSSASAANGRPAPGHGRTATGERPARPNWGRRSRRAWQPPLKG